MPLSTGWILAGVAAAGGIAYVVIRRQQAAAEERRQQDGGGRCRQVKAAAELARQSGDPRALAAAEAAVAVCEAGSMLDDVLGNPFEGTDAHNTRLNGPPKRRADAALMGQTFWWAGTRGRDGRGSYRDSELGLGVLEYENGCVPFPEAPGWDRCAPSTRPQCKPFDVGAQDVYSTACARAGLGGRGDPTTRRHRTRDELAREQSAGEYGLPVWRDVEAWKEFPLACKPGEEKWWVKGKATCLPACPAGTERTGTEVDHREGATGVPRCWSTDVTVPPPSSGPRPSSGGILDRARQTFGGIFREDPAR